MTTDLAKSTFNSMWIERKYDEALHYARRTNLSIPLAELTYPNTEHLSRLRAADPNRAEFFAITRHAELKAEAKAKAWATDLAKNPNALSPAEQVDAIMSGLNPLTEVEAVRELERLGDGEALAAYHRAHPVAHLRVEAAETAKRDARAAYAELRQAAIAQRIDSRADAEWANGEYARRMAPAQAAWDAAERVACARGGQGMNDPQVYSAYQSAKERVRGEIASELAAKHAALAKEVDAKLPPPPEAA